MAKVAGSSQEKQNRDAEIEDALLDSNAATALIRIGLFARDEVRGKNRLIFALCIVAIFQTWLNITLVYSQPDPKLLGETTDGRIRPLPLLDAPMYTDPEILAWAEKCVTKIYDLSYVGWEKHVQNETGCLSDEARAGFVKSLKQIGVLSYLTKEKQGVAYAIPQGAVLRKGWLAKDGYYQWLIEVPYRLTIEGKQRGASELVMQMQIRRVSLTWREDGLWTQNYRIRQKGNK